MSVTWPLAVKLLGEVLAVDRPQAVPQFQRADALRRLEEECLQAELLAQQLQQVLVLLLHQGPQVFDAAGPLAGGAPGSPGLLAAGLDAGFASSMPTALSVAARTSGGRSSAMFMLSVPSNKQPQGGTLAALDREREDRLGQQEQHLAKHGGPNHEQHDPPAAMPVGLMAEVEHGRRGHQAQRSRTAAAAAPAAPRRPRS